MSSAIEASENSERTEDCAGRIQEACDNETALNCIGRTDGRGWLRMISSIDRIICMKSSFTRVLIRQIANRAKSPIFDFKHHPNTLSLHPVSRKSTAYNKAL